jgi:acyl-CoA dehydrogenase
MSMSMIEQTGMIEASGMIEESVGRLFAKHVDKPTRTQAEQGHFPAALWRLIEDAGFTRALVAESAGGVGETWQGAYPIFRGIGHWQVPLPLAETMIAAQLLSMAGLEIPDGPITLIEQSANPHLRAETVGANTVLSGTAHRVPFARHCPWAVVSLTSGQIALLDLTARAGLRLTPAIDPAGMPIDTLELDGLRLTASAANPLPGLAEPIWTLGAAATGMMMVGAMESVLAQSVQYANDRVQFGRPIGKYQAIQQQLALMAGDAAASRVAALVAAADMPSADQPDSRAALFSAAVAKVRCGEAATRCTSIAHQVHGAIGFTYEHPLNFATRRLSSWREAYGSDAAWAKRLGTLAIQAGGARFWPAVTERNFEPPPAAKGRLS